MPSTTRRRSNSSDGGDGFVSGFFDAVANRKKAELDFKTAMMKMKAQSMMRMQEAKAKQQMLTQTPEQQYLRRRAMQENPLSQFMIPEEGSDSQEVEFPATQVSQDSKGLYQEKAIPEKKQGMMFMTAYNKMIESGKKPSPLATKIYEKYYNKTNAIPKEKQAGEYKPNKATQDFLDKLSDGVSDGSVKTRKDAQNLVEKHGSQLGIRGADVGHIYKQIDSFLPDKAEEKPGLGETIAKIGNAIYKKIGGSWQVQKEENPDKDLEEA